MPDETLVIVDDRTARCRLQTADILVADVADQTAAERWVTTTLTAYPGCLLAVARARDGKWCLCGSRDGATFLVRALENRGEHWVVVLARAFYCAAIEGRDE
jgi:hypothetical protein